MKIPVEELRLDGGTQPRASIDYAIVEDYQARIEAGDRFPPIVAFFDGATYWLADGFHRVIAHQNLQLHEIDAEVQQGGRDAAVWFSCSANRGHGLRRTNADKRRAVETALRLRPGESDRAIAEHCGVSQPFVSSMRPVESGDNGYHPAPRTGKDGKKQATGSTKKKAAAQTRAAKQAKAPAATTAPTTPVATPPRPTFTCPDCAATVPAAVVHCPHCDEHTSSARAECQHCGEDVRAAKPPIRDTSNNCREPPAGSDAAARVLAALDDAIDKLVGEYPNIRGVVASHLRALADQIEQRAAEAA